MVFLILSQLLAINKVLINTNDDTITFIDFFNKQTIYSSDIRQYFDTVYQNGFKSWHGLLIETNDNQTIQVVEQNVKLVLELKDYLIKKGIFCAGKKKREFPFR
ncbi:hypothetical protein A0257_18935 [Hymenobacter psoromatis]|nr:hypothetical protein A0257_18935 [Hymenobacter psoromatis]